MVAGLPADLPACICVVLHVSAGTPSMLAGNLARAGWLPCRPTQDGDALVPGSILVAPPNRHLLVEDGRVRLTSGPRENNHRPSVDALFRSAAEARRESVVGFVLSGMRDDGPAGLAVIKSSGGLAPVQDPRDALHPGMPAAAIDTVEVDGILRCEELSEAIAAAANGGPMAAAPGPDPPAVEGRPLTLACPECGGVLSEIVEAGVPRWECHVGRLYSPGTLRALQAVERALQAEQRGHALTADQFRGRALEADVQAESVLTVLRDSAEPIDRTDDDEELA